MVDMYHKLTQEIAELKKEERLGSSLCITCINEKTDSCVFFSTPTSEGLSITGCSNHTTEDCKELRGQIETLEDIVKLHERDISNTTYRAFRNIKSLIKSK